MGKLFKTTAKALLVIGVAAWLAVALSTFTTPENGKRRILFIAKSGESNFWKTVFQGANAAASEYNVELIIRAPQREDDYATQNEWLLWAEESRVDAVVFSACDYDKSVKEAEHLIASGIPIISIDSPIHSDKVKTHIGTNNVLAGKRMAQEIGRLTNYRAKIGIINCEEAGAVAMQREEGFLESLRSYPDMELVETRYTLSNVENPKQNTLEMLAAHPEINAIATFNEWTTLGVGEAMISLSAADEDFAVIGFDNNLNSIAQLEKGVLDCLIVQNPFAMGYLGVEHAIGYKKEKTHEAFIDTETKVITAKNMYNLENQKLLFPFSEEKNGK